MTEAPPSPTSPPSWMTWSRPEVRAALERTDLVVLSGGTSSEREVSLASGEAVLRALGTVDGPPPRSVRAVEIDARGRWRIDGSALDPDAALRALPPASLFFNALHGGEGENGVLQDFLGSRGRRYTGSGVRASSLCMDKGRTRQELRKAGLATAPGRLVRRAEWGSQARRVLMELASLPGEGGWFVKPNQGGSSVGVVHVSDGAQLERAIVAVLESGDEALVEARVAGLEETVGVLGLGSTGLVSLPVVEILPRGGGWFDYAQKYDEEGAEELCPPRELPQELWSRLGDLGRAAFQAAGCEGYARVDFVVPAPGPTGKRAEPVVLEINTLPGLTPRSLLPRAAAAAGADLRCLVLEIAALALLRQGS